MNPTKVNRAMVTKLTDLPNIGKASAADFRLLGIETPDQLIGRCPFEMFESLCKKTGTRHDPCVIDVFMSVTRFMAGEDARVWWDYTDARKTMLLEKPRKV